MEINSIGKRGAVITFDELEAYITNIYVCFARDHTYLIDTYCGPDIMAVVKDYINERSGDKPIIVVNTHFHWDHVWGNCAFPEEKIMAHELCRSMLEEHWDSQLNENHGFQSGQVVKRLPTFVIKDHWADSIDHVAIYHTPGHTSDSISFLDVLDDVLFVGDNVEFPVPYVESSDIEQYIKTLQTYLEVSHRHYIAGHADHTSRNLIESNIQYLENLRNQAEQFFIDPYASRVHQMNLDFLRSKL